MLLSLVYGTFFAGIPGITSILILFFSAMLPLKNTELYVQTDDDLEYIDIDDL